jgi:hypothetical protein
MAKIESLAGLIKASETLTVWIEYREGIEFLISYVSRNELQAMAKRSTVYKYDPVTKVRAPTLDQNLLTREFCKAAIKDWRGVTPNSLSKLVPIDLTTIAEEDYDSEIAFSQENVTSLVQKAYELDNFLQESAIDIRLFTDAQDTEDREKN